MKHELGKYHLRFAWFPKTIEGKRVWLKNFYQTIIMLPLAEPVYTTKSITVETYLIESLKGNIVNGVGKGHLSYHEEVSRLLDSFIDRAIEQDKDEKLH